VGFSTVSNSSRLLSQVVGSGVLIKEPTKESRSSLKTLTYKTLNREHPAMFILILQSFLALKRSPIHYPNRNSKRRKIQDNSWKTVMKCQIASIMGKV
jgi:hypothetical protein